MGHIRGVLSEDGEEAERGGCGESSVSGRAYGLAGVEADNEDKLLIGAE